MTNCRGKKISMIPGVKAVTFTMLTFTLQYTIIVIVLVYFIILKKLHQSVTDFKMYCYFSPVK